MEQPLVDFDPRLQGPFSMIIAGPSNSGKTHLVSTLINCADELITPHVDKVLYYYGQWQPAFETMNLRIQFRQGLPAKEELELNELNTPNKVHTLCIVDDLMKESDKEILCDIFTKGSHHWFVSIIYITQNIFENTPAYRTMSTNASYLVMFKNPRNMAQIMPISRQVFPKTPNFLTEVYNGETTEPHSYIVADFKQATPQRFRVRSSITSPLNQLIFTSN